MASGCHEATGASRRRSSWRRRRSSGPSGTAGSFVCVVRGRPRDYAAAHPTRPALVAEVAESGLRASPTPGSWAWATASWRSILSQRGRGAPLQPARSPSV